MKDTEIEFQQMLFFIIYFDEVIKKEVRLNFMKDNINLSKKWKNFNP